VTPWLERVRAALAPQGYDVERELESGGMGTVFLARHRRLDRLVAIKIIRPELHTAQAAERFRLEAKTLGSFSHPNIVPIHDAADADGMPYYEMDYLVGDTLATRLERGPLSLDEARKLGRDLLDGLEAAHRTGVVHRDVKPGNVFLANGRAVLVDFGVAKTRAVGGDSALTAPGAVVGTLDYMPPEQAAGGEVTPRTDLYAVGMVLYEALTGRHWSWDRPERAEWSGVPRGIARVLRRALAVAPEERWPDAATFRRALWRTRTRRYAWRTAALAALTLIAGMILEARRGPRAPPVRESELAILPFAVRQGSDSLLGKDLARLAAVHLEGLEEYGLTLTPRERAFTWWDSARGDPVALQRAAPAHLRTKHWVQGVVAERDGKVEVRVTVFDAAGHRQASAPLHGTTADPATLGFEIGSEIARSVRPDLLSKFRPVAGLSNATVGALREFQRGEDAFEQEAWQTAQRHYQQALTLDSTLDYVRWRLALAQYWTRVGPGQVALAHLYRARASGLSELDRELLAAMVAPSGPVRFAAFDSAVQRFPTSATAPMLYGWELLHRGALAGVPLDSAARVLAVAAGRNPSLGQAYTGLAWVWIRLGQRDSAERALRHLREVTAGRGDLDLDLPALWDLAFAGRFGSAQGVGPPSPLAASPPRGLAQAFRFALSMDIPGTELALGRLISGARGAPPAVRADGHEAAGLALLALGRGRLGLAQLDSAAGLYGTAEARFQALEWRLLAGALGLPLVPAGEVARARAALRDATRDPARGGGARGAWALALDGFARRDTSDVRRWAALARPGAGAEARRLAEFAGALQLATTGDELGAIAATDSLIPAYLEDRGGDPFVRAALHIERAEWYEALGRASDAEREWLWYENADIQGWPTGEAQAGEVDWVFGVYARLRRGALALSRGDPSRGCGHLRRVVELWAEADAELADVVSRAQRLAAACRP